MAQNETDIKRLILEAMDTNSRLQKTRILLDIAMEQLAFKDNPKTLERIEVLLDEYVSSCNCCLEDLEYTLKKLRSVSFAAIKS
ncbi:hypothetical protein, partial [[Scytonema hofmanni] UTEX B 1581]